MNESMVPVASWGAAPKGLSMGRELRPARPEARRRLTDGGPMVYLPGRR